MEIALISIGLVLYRGELDGVTPSLFTLGYTLTDGVLHAPDGSVATTPTGPADLGNGVHILPVVHAGPEPGAGQYVAGTSEVITGTALEIRNMLAETVNTVPTLEQAKATKQAEIRDKAQAVLAPYAVQYGQIEMQTWDQQAAEARAFDVDQTAKTPLLTPMAAARNMTVAALAARILANEAAWKAISGVIIGQRLAYQDRLDAATTLEAVQTITVEYSLPGA